MEEVISELRMTNKAHILDETYHPLKISYKENVVEVQQLFPK